MGFRGWIRRSSQSPGIPPDAPANNYPLWVLVTGLVLVVGSVVAGVVWLALGKPDWEVGLGDTAVRALVATVVAGLVLGVMFSLPGNEREWPVWARLGGAALIGAGTWLGVFLVLA